MVVRFDRFRQIAIYSGLLYKKGKIHASRGGFARPPSLNQVI